MARRNESPAEVLLKLPWWVSAILGLLVFAAMRWGLPAWAGDDHLRLTLVKGIVRLAPLILILFGLLALGSFFMGFSRRRLVDQQTGVDSLRNTSWKQFEFLVAEAFRRQGWQVDFSLGGGADGGVDLVLRREGRTALVQCKQWKARSVGASVVRELFGLMVAEDTDEAIIVTSGHFTREAEAFAEDKPIRLIDGPELLALVQSVRGGTGDSPVVAGVPPSTINQELSTPQNAPACPQCTKPMLLRTARRGANAGKQFWGCSTYPNCSGTRSA